MADGAIKDFFLELGFDAKAVDEGLKKIQKDLSKLKMPSSKQLTTALTRQIKDTTKLNSLENKRLRYLKQIYRYEKLGGDISGLHNKRRIKDPNKLDTASRELAELIARKEREIYQEKVRQNEQIKIAQQLNKQNLELARAASREEKIQNRNIDMGYKLQRIDDRALEGMSRTEGTPELNHYRALRAEVEKLHLTQNKTSKQWRELAGKMNQLNDATTRLTRRNRELNRQMTTGQFSAKAMKDSLNNLARSYVSVFAVMSGGRAIVNTGQQLIGLRNAILGVSGDSVQAAEDFEFVKSESVRLGVSLTNAAESYGKLGAAARAAGLSQQQTNEIFSATAELATAFNLGSADYAGVSRAMSQIMSKGKVSTEELLQLGERIPIAFSSAAEALNVSTKELFKLIETGQIQSVDFAPEVVKHWRSYVRETGMLQKQLESSRASMGRFATSVQTGVMKIMDSGLEKGLYRFFDSLRISVEQLYPAFETLGVILGTVVDGVGILVRMVTQMYRPAAMFFNMVFAQGNKTNGVFRLLTNILRDVIAWLIFPFALLEDWNDAIEKLDGNMKMLASGGMAAMNAMLTIMFLRLLGITKLISPIIALGKWLFKKGKGGGGAAAGMSKAKVGGVLAAGAVAYDSYNVLNSDTMGADEKGQRLSGNAGLLAGGLAGAKAGAAVGTMIAPGAGTAVGGLIGGILGGIAGQWGGEGAYNFFSPQPKGVSSAVVPKPATNIGTVSFNIDGSKDPKAVAREVMSIMDSQLVAAVANH